MPGERAANVAIFTLGALVGALGVARAAQAINRHFSYDRKPR